jgi:hypothetical protein
MSSSDRTPRIAKAARRPAKVTAPVARRATASKEAKRAPVQRATASKKPAAPKKPKAVAPAPATAPASLSDESIRLAGQIEQALKEGRLEVLTPEAMQVLIAALCKLYSANVEQGAPYLPVNSRSGVTPTDVMVVASKLLRATNLQVFELGMWQSWTGR